MTPEETNNAKSNLAEGFHVSFRREGSLAARRVWEAIRDLPNDARGNTVDFVFEHGLLPVVRKQEQDLIAKVERRRDEHQHAAELANKARQNLLAYRHECIASELASVVEELRA